MQVNKKETNALVQKIDDIVMTNSEQLLKDLDNNIEDLAGLVDIAQDRFVQSSDLPYALSLAKLVELKLLAMKQKNDVLKTLTSYKTAETSNNKKGPGELSISDLLNSAALGSAIGSKINMSGQQPKMIDSNGIESVMIDVQVEAIQNNLPSAESVAETLMKDFK